MKKVIKWILVIFCSGILFYSIVFSFLFFSLPDVGKFYSKQDLVNNYNQRSQQLEALKTYINQIVPDNITVDIEFDGNKRLDMFHITENDHPDNNWDLKIESKKVDTLLSKLGWTYQTLDTLKAKLDAANCISVKNGEPCNIGFQRSGMGKYYYNLFSKPIPADLKPKYNDSCTYIVYKENVVLEYGGGVLGPQCFPGVKLSDGK